MLGSPIFSAALRHHARIPYLFASAPTLCPNPLSFRWLAGIMFGSPIVSVTLQHRVRIPYLFGDSLASCPDPLPFRRHSDIVSGSPIFLTAPRHRVQIPYLFSGSPISCSDPLIHQRLSDILLESLSPQSLWPNSFGLRYCCVGTKLLAFDFFTRVHFYSLITCVLCSRTTRSFTLLKRYIFVDPQFCPLTIACILGVSPTPNFCMSRPWSPCWA